MRPSASWPAEADWGSPILSLSRSDTTHSGRRRSRTASVVGAAIAGTGMAGAGLAVRKRRPEGAEPPPLRSLVSRMTFPLLPDDYLRLLNPLWTSRELRGRVVSVVPETEQAATLVIKPGWGWSSDYRPGQYVGIGIQINGRWHWRSYSLTSTPIRDRGNISITVKAMPEGFLSGHLVNGLATGTIVRLARPQGDFVLPDPPPAHILFLTAGSGITPVMSILRTLHRRDTMPDVTVVHSAPDAAQTLFRDELHELASAHPSLRLHEQHTDSMGTLELHRLTEVCPDWADRQTWACGPPAMLDAAERLWKLHGIAGSLHVERFSVARTGAGGEGGEITFGRAGRTAKADGATSILEAGEQIGVQMPFGCRMGICQTCVVPLLSGTVRDLRSGNLYHEGDRIQTCISSAAGDCTLEV